MAKLEGNIKFIGTIDNVTAYKTRFSDQIILRSKGGVTKERIKHDPKYVRTRENNAEFGGCALASKLLRASLGSLSLYADHNITPVINGICKRIQLTDPIHGRGSRSILFSTARPLLEAISYNRRYPFTQILKSPLEVQLDRATGSLTLGIPELIPGINFNLPWQKPYYQLVITLGLVADVYHDGLGYTSVLGKHGCKVMTVDAGWTVSRSKREAQQITVAVTEPGLLDDPQVSLVAGIGIAIGEPDLIPTQIRMVRHLGAARVLAVR